MEAIEDGNKDEVSLWNLKFHPIEKEHHLPNHHFFVFHVNFPGCTYIIYVCIIHIHTRNLKETKQCLYIYIYTYDIIMLNSYLSKSQIFLLLMNPLTFLASPWPMGKSPGKSCGWTRAGTIWHSMEILRHIDSTFMHTIHPRSLAARHWKMMLRRQAFSFLGWPIFRANC